MDRALLPSRGLLLASGFAAGVTQVLLIRELLLACFGNEVALGLTLCAWLLCGAAGAAWAGRRPAGDRFDAVRRVFTLSALWAPASFSALLTIRAYPFLAERLGLGLARALSHWPSAERLATVHLAVLPGEMLGPLHLLAISLLGALGPALLAGALFAGALQTNRLCAPQPERAAGQAYALDAVGHLVGGLLLGWAAIVVLDPFTIALAAAAVLLFAAMILRIASGAAFGNMHLPWVALAVLLVSLPSLQRHSLGLRWQGREVAEHRSTLYGEIAVSRQGTEGAAFYANGVPMGLSPALPHVPQLVHFALLQHPAPARVLVIGGGATGGVQEILKHHPKAVDYAELDPAMLPFARRWVSEADRRALVDPRVTLLAADGRILVKQAARGLRPRYDAIISLLPDPSTALLNRYYTAEWFAEARQALNPGGVLAWEMASSRHYLRSALHQMDSSILGAAELSFPRRALMTGDGTLAVVVGDESANLSDDPREVRRRLERRGVRSTEFAAVINDRLEPYSKQYVLDALTGGPPGPVNRDLLPVAYLNAQATWVGLYYPDLEFAGLALSKVTLRGLGSWGGALVLGLALLGLWRPVRRGYVPLALGGSGLVGMLLTLCAIYAYQAYVGYVYHLVGMLTGVFMVGLAAGAWWSPGAGRPSRGWGMVAGQVALGALALALPWGLRGVGAVSEAASPVPATIACALLMTLTGLAVGVQFPLANRAALDQDADARAASRLYAAELTGSALGAALAGTVLIPVLGVVATCLACAGLCGALAVLLCIRASWRA